MSRPKKTDAVKLVMSVIYTHSGVFREVMQALSDNFGRPDFITAPMTFDFTNYYDKEMGNSLSRRMVSFDKHIPPEILPDVKLFTNRIEDQFSDQGCRRANIDPGYLSAAHLILATGKGYSHRPYLRDGIYADLTLIYQNGAFEDLKWTYPDYASAQMKAVLDKMRRKYLQMLKAA